MYEGCHVIVYVLHARITEPNVDDDVIALPRAQYAVGLDVPDHIAAPKAT
jgi:hypothetical protein